MSEVTKALHEVHTRVVVTSQRVAYAKSYVLKNFDKDTSALLAKFLQSLDAPMPRELVVHASVDTKETVRLAAESFSWALAFCEAIWGLISSNLIIPASPGTVCPVQSLRWTTQVSGGGGEAGTRDFSDLAVPVPSQIMMAPSRISGRDQPLSDPDLYLHHLAIPNMSDEVEAALREAVQCFRHDLFLACLALLGKASEGAWIELGIALSQHLPKDREKEIAQFEGPLMGIGKKITRVLQLYERNDLFGGIYAKSEYSPKELRSVVIWADAVRESRNSIHYGAKVSMPNSYEKVAALMIGAVQHLKVVYAIIGAASSHNA